MSSYAAAGPARDQDKYICFELSGQEFGLPIQSVKETVTARPLTRVPFCPDFIAGLMNLRGDVVAILDLGLLLRLGPSAGRGAVQEARRIVLLRSSRGTGHGAICGLLIDRLTEARRIPEDGVRPVPATLPDAVAPYLNGVARIRAGAETNDQGQKRLLLLLDPDCVLSAEALRPFRHAPAPVGPQADRG